jgi:hypothetical protein
MAVKGDITLVQSGMPSVVLSPFGRKLIIKPTEISRSGRTASGKLRRQIVAVKHTFELPYSYIDGDALNTLLSLYDLKCEMSLYIYYSPTSTFLNDNGAVPTVLLNPIQRERLTMLGVGIWTGSTLTMDEV